MAKSRLTLVAADGRRRAATIPCFLCDAVWVVERNCGLPPAAELGRWAA